MGQRRRRELREKAAAMKQDLRSQEQIAADAMIAEARKAASACLRPTTAFAARVVGLS